MEKSPSLRNTIAIFAVTQILTWGSMYYAFAILAHDMGRSLGIGAEWIFGAFSWSLLVAGVCSTPVGILLDRHGGRPVMMIGSLVCGAGFLLLSQAQGGTTYFLAWTVLGVSMSALLYEGAFAALTHLFPLQSRKAISTLTLFGGFASTVFWPLTLALNGALGWRNTVMMFAFVHLMVCLPLHAMLAKGGALATHKPRSGSPDFSLKQALRHPAFWQLAFAFSANSFIFSALSVHLIPILNGLGHSMSNVVWMAMLIGPMQVAGRVSEMLFARYTRPQAVGKLCFSILPAALFALLFFGQNQVAVALFCILYGLSNGILTIVRGTVPQILFGSRNYGAISGALAGPALVSKAAGPLAIALVIQMNSSPAMLFGLLLAFSLASLAFYLLAVRSHAATAVDLAHPG